MQLDFEGGWGGGELIVRLGVESHNCSVNKCLSGVASLSFT